VKILPERFGIQPTAEGPNALSFSARQPFRIAIKRDGRNSPLLLFGNPLETNLPQPGDTNVVYFGPGVHKPVKVRLTDNQTLYLAGGAVVKGCVEAKGQISRCAAGASSTGTTTRISKALLVSC
jgi:hypothetical protein